MKTLKTIVRRVGREIPLILESLAVGLFAGLLFAVTMYLFVW